MSYTAKLTQDDGATLLLRFSPNIYSQYSIDGTVWYDISTVSAEGSLSPVEVDGTTIIWVAGRLSVNPEVLLPPGGTAGQVLTKTATGEAWLPPASVGYGDGLLLNTSAGVVNVVVDGNSIVIDNGALHVPSQIPTTGTTGYVLTKTSTSWAWMPQAGYTFSSGLSVDGNTVTAKVDNDTIAVNSSGALEVVRPIPSGGSAGQVLTRASDGYSWGTPVSYDFTTGLDLTGNAVSVLIDGESIRVNNGGQLFAVSEIPDGGYIGQTLIKSSDGLTWGDPTSNLTFEGGVVRTINTVSVVVDNSTIIVNSSGQLEVVPELPAGGTSGQVLTRNAGYGVEWRTPETMPTFSGGLAVNSGTVVVDVDNETVVINGNGKVSAVRELPSGGDTGQVLTKTQGGVAWVSAQSPLVFEAGLSQLNNTVVANVDDSTIKVTSGGKLTVPSQIPANGNTGDVLTKLPNGYAWAPPTGGGSGGGGGGSTSYIFTGGLLEEGGYVVADIDEQSIVLNNDGKLTAVSEIPDGGIEGQALVKGNDGLVWRSVESPLSFSGGLVRSSNTVTIDVDNDTVVLNSSGKLTATRELPTDGMTGQVLTKTGAGVTWESVQSPLSFGEGLSSSSSGLITAHVDETTVSVDTNGALVVVNPIPSTGTTGYVLTKTNDGYAWLPTQGGGSGGSGGASYLFTDGLIEVNGIVSIDFDSSTLMLNSSGKLETVVKPLTFSDGLVETGGTVVADVDNSTIVIDSSGKIAAVPELPSGGTTGQVLTVAGSSLIWNTPTAPPAPVYPINTKKFSTTTLTLEEEEVPLYLVNSAGKMYAMEPGTSLYNSSTSVVTLNTEAYRAYENLGPNDHYEWDLIYLKNGREEYEELEPFTLRAISGGTVQLGDYNEGYTGGLYYRLGSVGAWTEYREGTVIPINQGDYIQFQGTMHLVTSFSVWHKFNLLGSFIATGNLQSMGQYEDTAIEAYGLFSGCHGLVVSGDILKAKTPNTQFPCYFHAFENCNNLTEIKIGLTSLNTVSWDRGNSGGMYYIDGCLDYMFYGCSSLSKIEVNFTSWGENGSYYTRGWVDGVAQQGVFIKPAELPEMFDDSRIPVGWTVINKDSGSESSN